MFQTKAVEKIKTTHFVFSDIFSENRAVCEIMWDNMVRPDKTQIGACALHAG
jgi:hypothetical protein